MYSRILVAMDGSPHSLHALEHALGLAKGLSARLRIVHVVDTSWLGLGMEMAIDTVALTEARREAGSRLLDQVLATARSAGLQAETRLLEMETPADHLAALIVKEATDWQAGLIVLGTHSRRGLDRMLMGSIAEGTARLSPMPVLLIPSMANTG